MGPATVNYDSQAQTLENTSHPRSDPIAVDPTDSLKMALLNVRSLSNKTFIVNDIIRSYGLDCILLTETWLDETGTKELIEASPSQFSFSQCNRPSKKGGGIAAIFSDILSCKCVLFGVYSTFEYLTLVPKSVHPCLVITIYRPPRLKKGFISEFGEFLSKITVNYDSILISGDFNIHIDNTMDYFSKQFTDLLSTFELTQHITGPTHNQGHTLDLVISKGLAITPKSTLDVGISDHFCIFFNVGWMTKPKHDLKLIKKRFIYADTSDRFIARYTDSVRCTRSDLDSNVSSLSLCDNLVNNLNTLVTQIMDDIAPVKTKLITGKTKAPWRNAETVKSLKRTCRKSERKWRKTKLQIDYNLYKDILSKYNNEIKQARQQYFSKIIAEKPNNSKFLFNTIDKLINPPRPIPTELQSAEKCNEFASFFQTQGFQY